MFAHATHTSPHGIVDSVSLFFARLGAAINGATEANRVYRELSSLSADALAARGLERQDIPRMAYHALLHGSR